MFSKPFAVGALAIACVAAAAGGAYVAVRQNEAPPVQAARPIEAVEVATPTSPAVQETEAAVGPPPVTTPLPVEEPHPAARAARGLNVPPAARRTTRPRPAAAARRSNEPPASTPTAAADTSPASAPAYSEPPTGPTRTEPGAAPALASADASRAEPLPPPAPSFDELVVPAAAVVGLQVQTAVSSERARVEDRVEARVTRDVAVDRRTAIPAGSRVIGSVTLVERGGKLKERARLGVRFHTLVLADGTELPIRTEAILREGDSPTGESTRKIGGAAAGGAILGAIIGGKKGAIVGGATGAAGGTAVVMSGDRNPATLPVGAVLTVRLSAPLTVAVERQQE